MNIQRYTISCLVAIASLVSLTPTASAFNIFTGDTNPGTTRSNFNNNFNTNSTSSVIDNGTTTGFGGTAPSVGTGLPSVSRTGSLNGSSFTYTDDTVGESNQ